jgi:hypothetical protein
VAIGDGTEQKGLPQPPKRVPSLNRLLKRQRSQLKKAARQKDDVPSLDQLLKKQRAQLKKASGSGRKAGPYAPKFGPRKPKHFYKGYGRKQFGPAKPKQHGPRPPKGFKRTRIRRGRKRGERQSFGSYKSSGFGLLRKILRMVGAPSFALPKPSLSFGSTRLPSFSASLRSSGGRKADGRNHGFNKVKKRGRTGLGGR